MICTFLPCARSRVPRTNAAAQHPLPGVPPRVGILGVPPETGKRANPSLKILKELAKALGVPVTDLLG